MTLVPSSSGHTGGTPTGAAGGDLGGTYPNPSVAKVAGVALSGTPSAGQVLTATGATAAHWAAAGGALSLVTVTLTNAQILALPTAAIQVVAAPAAGSMLVPIHGFLALLWAGDYTNIDANARLGIESGSLGENNSLLCYLSEPVSRQGVSALLASGDSEQAVLGPEGTLGDAHYLLGGMTGENTGLMDGQPLQIVASNGAAGNFTGGNASNKLSVTVIYYTLTLPT